MIDLKAIKERLAAATPGPWVWWDTFGGIPSETNDGSQGVEDLGRGHPELADGESFPDEPLILQWRDMPMYAEDTPREIKYGGIAVSNIADLTFIASAPTDIAALIAEVERLQALVKE